MDNKKQTLLFFTLLTFFLLSLSAVTAASSSDDVISSSSDVSSLVEESSSTNVDYAETVNTGFDESAQQTATSQISTEETAQTNVNSDSNDEDSTTDADASNLTDDSVDVAHTTVEDSDNEDNNQNSEERSLTEYNNANINKADKALKTAELNWGTIINNLKDNITSLYDDVNSILSDTDSINNHTKELLSNVTNIYNKAKNLTYENINMSGVVNDIKENATTLYNDLQAILSDFRTNGLNNTNLSNINTSALINNVTAVYNETKDLIKMNVNLTNTIGDLKENATSLYNDLQALISGNNSVKLNTSELVSDVNDMYNKLKDLTDKQISTENLINKINNTTADIKNKLSDLQKNLTNLINQTGKYVTRTTVSPLNGSVGSLTQLKATVPDANGKNINDGRVVFKVNGITVKDEVGNTLYAMVNNGVATINHVIPKSWFKDNTTVEAIYSGNGPYLSSKATSTNNTITEGTVKIKISDLPSHENGDKIQFVVIVTDDSGESMTGGVVIMKVNGVTLKDSKGNTLQANVKDGVAVLDYNITLGAKLHNLTAVYAYTGYYRAEAKTTLNITKDETFIRYTPVTTKTTTTTITADILDKNKNHIYGNSAVSIRIDGKVVDTITCVDGLIKATITTNLSTGVHTIAFAVGENGAFKSDRLTSVIIKQ